MLGFLINMGLSKGMISRVSLSMRSCKSNNIEKPGLKVQKVKALYPEEKFRHISM